MKIWKAYKTELAPNNKQIGFFNRCAGVSRFVFNFGLATWQQQYEDGEKPSAYGLKKLFNSIKYEQCSFVTDVPYAITESAFNNLGIAFKNFFRRVKQGDKPGYPKFKSKKKSRKSFQLKSIKRVEIDRIKLPFIGWVRLKERNYIPTQGKYGCYATISEKAGRWFISVLVEETIPDIENDSTLIIGIDLGLKTLAVLSNGKEFENQKPLIAAERKLKRLQRELARRKKGSANREKTRKKLAKQYAKVANIRKHILHQISHYCTAELRPKRIVLENLNVSGMMKNHCLAKAISDVGFYELRRQIEYKAEKYGIEVVIADRWYASSKLCSGCGWKDTGLKLSDRTFECPECGLTIDRDLNAAMNLAAYE